MHATFLFCVFLPVDTVRTMHKVLSIPYCLALPLLCRKYRQLLDKSTIHVLPRWLVLIALLVAFALRIAWLGGWFIVTYGLGIYILNLFVGFLSPQVCSCLL